MNPAGYWRAIRNEGAALKPVFLGLAGALAVSLAMLGYAVHAKKHAEQRREESAARLGRLLAEVEQRSKEREWIEQYRPAYRVLEERGAIGEERRLVWVERVESALARHGREGARYGFEPRLAFAREGEQEARKSTMNLEFSPLHEERLLSLLEELREDGSLLDPAACEVQREEAEGATRLSARCRLDWITLGPAAGETGETPP